MSQIKDKTEENWDLIIRPKNEGTALNISELLRYKDLLILFVKRDFISLYKQTILGPLWVVIQPILTTITLYIVFTKIAQVGTGGVPEILFYMIGVTVWTYFADCVLKTSDTFILNQNIFGKVYFPRLIVPFSLVITNLVKFGVQILLFLAVYAFYEFGVEKTANIEGEVWGMAWQMFLLPVLLVTMAFLGLGVGLIISALTTKYRDLRFLIQFGIQLAMYATPVVWPLSKIDEKYQWILALNPMTGIVESFKVAFFGETFAVFSWFNLAYSFVFSLIVLLIGMKLFSRVEKSFMDTI
jgi:lipopolysaccharide transport system permease protein